MHQKSQYNVGYVNNKHIEHCVLSFAMYDSWPFEGSRLKISLPYVVKLFDKYVFI